MIAYLRRRSNPEPEAIRTYCYAPFPACDVIYHPDILDRETFCRKCKGELDESATVRAIAPETL